MCDARVILFEIGSTGTNYMQVYSDLPKKVIICIFLKDRG